MKWKFDPNDYVHLNPLIQAGFRFVTVKAKDVQNKNLPRSIRGEKIEDCDPEDEIILMYRPQFKS